MLGPIQLEFRERGHRVVMTMSDDWETVKRVANESEVIEGVEVPRSIELTTSGGPGPDMHARVELRDGSPVLTELSWKSGPGQGEIQQKHLRRTEIAKLVTDLVVSTIAQPATGSVGPLPTDDDELLKVLRERKRMRQQSTAVARRFVERQRLPRERRVMTPEFLQQVANVYRENIDGNPTKAVETTFNVRYRMAGKYVEAARQRGLLSKTERGRKKA
ncbi:hypothetical protein [Mycobacterium paragordonae]|uniref:hypothetical protein n=1 Tax=Mycobacterium paragordonae TaxID=1389713 RepID=UPI0010617283|nr:hypothetical protein [Mycobacterium paragordonae]TDL02151.1 hypothetical protein EUA05_27775 [Mycobacterium paragordonae]